MRRPYYIPPIVTAAFIALGMLASVASSTQACTETKEACVMAIETEDR